MLKVADIVQAQQIMLERLENLHVPFKLNHKPFSVYMNLGTAKYNRIYIWWDDPIHSTHTMHEDIELENTEVPAELLQ